MVFNFLVLLQILEMLDTLLSASIYSDQDADDYYLLTSNEKKEMLNQLSIPRKNLD